MGFQFGSQLEVVKLSLKAASSLPKADTFVKWAFEAHEKSPLVQRFLETLKSCSRSGSFADGVPVASICTGWGVAEMIMESLNERIQKISPGMPKERVQIKLSQMSAMFGFSEQLNFQVFLLWTVYGPCPVCASLPLRSRTVESGVPCHGFSALPIDLQ